MEKKDNHHEFISKIEERNIEYLIHFTPTINLYSIFEQKKIMSRAALEIIDIEQFDVLDYIQFTDNIRYDDKNYINLSISSPNTFLFSKFRQKTKNDFTIKWCVLQINPKHIYEKNTLFAVTNAASNAAKKQFGISGEANKFEQMFSPELKINTFNSGIRTIKRNGIKAKYPTDVQAEVLVKNYISTESIINACFQTEEDLAEAKGALYEFDTSNFIVDKEIFSPIR